MWATMQAVTATSQQQEAKAVLAVENWLPSWEPEELCKQQGDDPDVNKAFISTREGAWSDSVQLAESQVFQSLWAQRQQLTVVDDLLYRKWEDVGGRGGNPGLQLVLPRTMVIQVLLLMHDNATAGHLGMQKTLAKIRSRFYWVGQCKDAEDWCRRCTECASRKSPLAARGPIKVVVTCVPFQQVAMDIIGPFSKTAKDNMYVLIIGDYFTKWVEAYPMSDMEATTVAKCLYDFICRFGAPDMHAF